jgi:2-keto-4-pentenoate hydratase
MTSPLTDEPLEIREDVLDSAACRLQKAATSQVPCAPVRDLIGPDDLAAAYAVQARVNHTRLLSGARVVGRKIGLTSPAVQAQLGVDQPDFGVLFEDMDHSTPRGDGAVVPLELLMQPKVEAEIAFVLDADLAEGDLDDNQVRAAVASVRPALEIVDSRIAGWDITFGDTVADNGSSGLFVLGDASRTLEEFEPKNAQMTMTRGNEIVSSGSGDVCLGDPLHALAWLARTARDVGDPLLAGQVVLSGALGPMVAVTAPSHFAAQITGLGSVSVTFSRKDSA